MMAPEAEVTAFSAMFTTMAVEYQRTKARRARASRTDAVGDTAGPNRAERDELEIRREMDAAVTRRFQQPSKTTGNPTQPRRGRAA